MNMAAGPLDRRIRIEEATEVRDKAGDLLPATWSPPTGWPREGRRWASKRDPRPNEKGGDGSSQVLLREIDTVFVLRWDRFSSRIAPETFRVVYRDRAYEIVGLGEVNREDGVQLLCSSRPDQRGTSAADESEGG